MTIKKIVHTQYIDEETEQEYQFEPIDNTIKLTKTKDGYELRYLTQDENPSSPDECGDDSLFLVHYHRDFYITNKIITEDVLRQWYQAIYYKIPEIKEPDETKDYYVLPVSALIHSGVWLSFAHSFAADSGGWDTSHVGAILVKKKEFGAGGVEFELSKDEAHTRAESLLQSWNEYLSGDVYCVVKETLDKDKQHIDFDIVGGFSGFEYAKECLETEI